MVPQFRVKLVKDFRPELVSMPSEEVLACEDGLICNHDYSDARGFSWIDFQKAYELESKSLKKARRASKSEFERIFDEQEGLDLWGAGELGVTSTIYALSAMGFAPATSCRGHILKRSHQHNYPYVAFWAPTEKAHLLVPAVQKIQVGLENCDLSEPENGAVVYARNITNMRRFARKLYNLYQE